ncbi:MAG: hypothetical protein HY088_06835 [Ignavibacteriales bacterium]|nr:hypothetical protein [Ignavibacteriales bacterium]
MQSSLVKYLLIFLPFCVLAQTRDQKPILPGQQAVTILLSPSDTSYKFPHEFITEHSERVVLDSTLLLRSALDYAINYRSGIIFFQRSTLSRIFSDSSRHTIVVSYRHLPFAFQPEYSLRDIIIKKDSLGKKTTVISTPSTKFSVDDLFGSGLQKSGSIVRGFTVGSNRDLSVNSGFRMQLAGKLSQELDIVAALTDENSPIQPEGTTQTLREVDKVFIELNSARYNATLGDFNFDIAPQQGGEFGRLSRKLQGAKGALQFKNFTDADASGSVSLIGATARGKFATNQFQGIEGNQGPYRLSSREGNQRLIIVAGTERAYINGELMERGETKDYTIDYASGEILFTPRRLITNASRITVDFEYTDRQFTRNLLGAITSLSFLNDRFKLNAQVVQEADDPDSPIDFNLDDATRNQLRESGADRLKASVSGVRFVGRDSVTHAAKGQYFLSDTTIGNKRYSFFVYAPGDARALYSVSFSFVDQVPPDSIGYVRRGVGQFQIAGLGKGNYLPVQFLPIPELHRVLGINTSAAISSDVTLTGEYMASRFDRNRLSTLDDQENQGGAFKLSFKYNPKTLMIGKTNLGELDVTLSERFVDKRFIPLERANEIEFNRKWDLSNSSLANEEIREVGVHYKPLNVLNVGVGYGLLERSGLFRSERTTANVAFADSTFPRASYNLESISSSDNTLNEKTSWIRQRGTLEYSFWKLQPMLRVESEERLQKATNALQRGSFRFLEIAPRLGISEIGNMSASMEFQIRTEDSLASENLQRASTSLTQMFTWQLREWNSLSSSLSLSARKTEFNEEFKKRGNTNSEIILVRSQSRYSPLQRALDIDLLYEFSNQRSAQLERAFVRVAKGNGNYRYKGDLNDNGIADDNEFELTRFDGDYIALFIPSDRLVPVVDLKTGLRFRFQPARLLNQPTTTFEKILKSVSTESFLRIEEKSTESDTRQIYLLNFQKFQDDRTTIAGSSHFTQDVYVFENDPTLSFRFRFNERNALVRLVSALERSYVRERSLRVRSQLIQEIGNQTEFANKIDRVLASSFSPRERDIVSNNIGSEFSYRPEPEWEVAFRYGIARSTDRFADQNITADINEQTLRLTYALFSAGQLRGEFEREEVVLSNRPNILARPLAFELTNGKVEGKTFLWQVAFDYRINQYMQVTVNYNGRSEGGNNAVHTARAEAKAFF